MAHASRFLGAVVVLAALIPLATAQEGACEIGLSVSVDDDTPQPGQVVRFTAIIKNWGVVPSDEVDLWLIAQSSSDTLRINVLGSGVIPGDTIVTRVFRLRTPNQLPAGTYFADFYLGSYENNEICDFARTTLTVNPIPGTGEGVAHGREIVTPEDGPFAAAVPVAVIPNPFSDQTTITFEVAEAADVRLALYDVLGREVAVLVDGPTEARRHTETFDGRGLPPGTYVYRLAVGEQVRTGRLTVAR